MIFVDTNILIDVVAPHQQWRDWSIRQIDTLGASMPLTIDQIVLAELASGFPTLEEATIWLGALGIEMRILDETAAFSAGLAYRAYRKAGRERTSMLPDFLIGAHADQLGATLLTRDARIYRRYFSDLSLITPETHP